MVGIETIRQFLIEISNDRVFFCWIKILWLIKNAFRLMACWCGPMHKLGGAPVVVRLLFVNIGQLQFIFESDTIDINVGRIAIVFLTIKDRLLISRSIYISKCFWFNKKAFGIIVLSFELIKTRFFGFIVK
ncbi:hypothetical protein D3C73_810700 [compost metagenome]